VVDQPVQFAAYGRSTAGDSALVAVAWTASGGTIGTDGRFKATKPGTYRVVGRHHEGHSDSAQVTVTPPGTTPPGTTPPSNNPPGTSAPALASIAVAPHTVSLQSGQQITFTTSGTSTAGTPMTPTGVSWSATGGSVAGGIFSAGTAAGTYRVVATSGKLADTATVTISSSPTPSPNPGTGAHPNEPAGYSLVTQRDFDAMGENGWLDGANGLYQLINDPTSPGASPRVGEMIFTPGVGNGGGISPSYAQAEGFPGSKLHRKSYMSFWMKVSPNWFGHKILGKIGYGLISGKAKFFLSLYGNGTSGLTLHAHSQGMYSGGSAGAVNFANNFGNDGFSRGQWHHVEVLLWANNVSTGAADGGLSWWLDGKPVGTAGNVAWVGPGESDTWDAFSWRPVWGAGSSPIPVNQSMYVDKFYVSGQ
jgi:hypothetical protein